MRGGILVRLEELYVQNPWWENPGAIDNDRHVIRFRSSSFKWEPPVMEFISLHAEGINTLRGPRQIGKSTVMKLLIEKLINTDIISPQKIMYLTLDNVSSREELVDILSGYINLRRRSFGDELLYIFLDEITMVEQWQYGLKYLMDTGLLNNVFAMLTGSSAHDLVASERMPGRRGKGRDFSITGATFRQLLETQGKSGIPSYELDDYPDLTGSDLEDIKWSMSRLGDELSIYTLSGGFPQVVDEIIKTSSVSETTRLTYRDVFLGEIERLGKRRSTLTHLTKQLSKTIGQRFSWQSLNKEVREIESVQTVISYVETLALNFMIGVVYYLDPNKREIHPRKQKKVFASDLIILNTIEDISGRETPAGSKIENIVYANLLSAYNTFSGLIHNEGPYFWYSTSGNEVDFLAGKSLTPIEVKYQNNIMPSDYLTMKRAFGRGILVSRSCYRKDGKITILPLEAFLATLGEDAVKTRA